MQFPNEHAFLTVDEAAEVLGVSRNTAYQATQRYRKTGGLEGLPVIKIGGCLRVPVAALERMAQTGIEEKEAS